MLARVGIYERDKNVSTLSAVEGYVVQFETYIKHLERESDTSLREMTRERSRID